MDVCVNDRAGTATFIACRDNIEDGIRYQKTTPVGKSGTTVQDVADGFGLVVKTNEDGSLLRLPADPSLYSEWRRVHLLSVDVVEGPNGSVSVEKRLLHKATGTTFIHRGPARSNERLAYGCWFGSFNAWSGSGLKIVDERIDGPTMRAVDMLEG